MFKSEGSMLMRVVLFSFFILISAGRLYSQSLNISFRTDKGERFTLFLNGEKKNKTPLAKVKLEKLDAPVYKIKVVLTNGKSVLKTLTPEPGHQSNYIIKKIGKSYKIVLLGSGPVPGLEVNQKAPPADSSSGKGTVVVDPSPQVQPAFIPGYIGSIGCPRPVNANEFAKIKKNIVAQSADADRQQVLKKVFNTNCLLSVQVKELLMFLSQDKTRLEFAKMAYPHTYDVGNYGKVSEAFVFETSANELNAYVSASTKPNK